jgi:AcrR family transcriptional regulator
VRLLGESKSNNCLRFPGDGNSVKHLLYFFLGVSDTIEIDGGSTKTDARREAGERTRQRLLEAASGLLAEHGDDAVRLRDITDAAHANVAAVHYHFGSKDALCREAMEHAVRRLLEEQIEGLQALPEDAPLAEIAAAWARPVIAAVCGSPCEERAFMRIMARVASDPPPELRDWMASELSRADPEFLAPLRRAVPGVPDDELRFRLECAAGILHFLSSGNMRFDLSGCSEKKLERLLTPVIAGALAGGPAAA